VEHLAELAQGPVAGGADAAGGDSLMASRMPGDHRPRYTACARLTTDSHRLPDPGQRHHQGDNVTGQDPSSVRT